MYILLSSCNLCGNIISKSDICASSQLVTYLEQTTSLEQAGLLFVVIFLDCDIRIVCCHRLQFVGSANLIMLNKIFNAVKRNTFDFGPGILRVPTVVEVASIAGHF